MSNIGKLEYHPMPDLEQLPECDNSEKVGGSIKFMRDKEELAVIRPDGYASIKESHQRANQSSGEVEWYTPPWLLERVKRVLGDIDLDPASCSTANLNVGAKQFFTHESDSLNRDWSGVVWMNHPYR